MLQFGFISGDDAEGFKHKDSEAKLKKIFDNSMASIRGNIFAHFDDLLKEKKKNEKSNFVYMRTFEYHCPACQETSKIWTDMCQVDIDLLLEVYNAEEWNCSVIGVIMTSFNYTFIDLGRRASHLSECGGVSCGKL